MMMKLSACQSVVETKIASLIFGIQLAETANSGKPDIFGLPLLYQILHPTHGSCISSTEMCATSVRLTPAMSVV